MVECRDRHPRNSEGPFYVVNGECIACGAPESESDGLMSSDEAGQCFFIRQPITEDETNAAVRGVWASCCGAVRYGGEDPEILTRLSALGVGSQCDQVPTDGPQMRRNCARFEYPGGRGILSRRTSLRQIVSYIAESLERHTGAECFAFHRWFSRASFRLRWGKSVEGRGHAMRFQVTFESPNRWLLRISEHDIAQTSFAIRIDKALRKNSGFRDIRWYAEYQLLGAEGVGEPHPY